MGRGQDRQVGGHRVTLSLPVLVDAYGPLDSLANRVHQLTVEGRHHEALDAADAYDALARELGDEKTRLFLLQGRMYALQGLGRHEEGVAAGVELARRHRAAGRPVSEAKTLADMAQHLFELSRWEDGVRHLGRAGWLLDGSATTIDRYWIAVASTAAAMAVAGLYEAAVGAFDRLAAAPVVSGGNNPGFAEVLDVMHAAMLLEWGVRLEQIGNPDEARLRFRRGATLACRARAGGAPAAVAIDVFCQAKLGRSGHAREAAAAVVVEFRAAERYYEARLAHLALGIALRDTGDLDGAFREFTAAQQLEAYGGKPVEALAIQYELALLAAARRPGDPANRVFLTSLSAYARQLWALRLQRMSSLRQARHRARVDEEHARVEQALRTDPLTGLGNRYRYDEEMLTIGAAGYLDSHGLLIIDVDHFKSINDDHSHSIGDQALQQIARLMRDGCRATDVVTRFGGDEFAVFLKGAPAGPAEVAERIRTAVSGHDWDTVSAGLRVTVSTGAAVLQPGMTPAELFEAADRHLYAAKRAGRNQVVA